MPWMGNKMDGLLSLPLSSTSSLSRTPPLRYLELRRDGVGSRFLLHLRGTGGLMLSPGV